MFELLFNESQDVWRASTLGYASGWPPYLFWLLLAIAAIGIILTLTMKARPMLAARRTSIGLLQLVAVFAALVIMWQPVLEVEKTHPGENKVAWLLDASRSMEIEDVEGDSRSAVAEAIVSRDDLIDEDLYDVERYTVAPVARRFDSPDAPSPEGSPIADSLSSLVDSVEDQALAAIVLVSDGADNQSQLSAAWWQTLAAAAVPVHVVGLGSTTHGTDVELADVQLPARAAVDATVTARVRVRHARRAGPVRLTVSSANELLHAEDIKLDPTTDETVHFARFTVPGAGVRELDFRISGSPDDPNTVNDAQTRIIQIQDQRRRVLYVEGEPRWEYKFLRRALEGHPGVELVSLLRTSPNKFYRQGVRDASELEDGFPRSREELFQYDAIIVGSFEAAQLDTRQQASLRDFVNIRGGALLMLGGREGLADGGWARSALAAALPVTLEARLDANTYARERVSVMPTRQGLRSGWLSLEDTAAVADANAALSIRELPPDTETVSATVAPPAIDPLALWRELPAVADHQSVGTVKPGALVLLKLTNGEPLYVTQRYGLGTSQVMGTGGTWRWQMGLPADDQRHERFWQTILVGLVEASLPRIDIAPESDVVRDRDTTVVHVVARDARFEPLTAESLDTRLIGPDGAIREAALVADPAQAGRFRLALPTAPAGVWSLQVDAVAGGESPSGESISTEAFWLTETEIAEDFNTRQQRSFLERVASVTGGSYLTHTDIESLPDMLQSSNAALTRVERLPLWNMPALFLLLLSAKLLEWYLRLRWNRL